MKYCIVLLLLACTGARAAAPCMPVRIGYSDRERAPYYMGNGGDVPVKPGVLVELFREAFRSVGCQVELVRLPVARVRLALTSGVIDIAPADTPADDKAGYLIATSVNGEPDHRRALRTMAYVFVRSSDRLSADTDPASYFKTHVLAVNQGTILAEYLKAAGLHVDDGSFSSWNNLDKLRLKRVDGFTLALMTPAALDPYVAKRYGKQVTRLDKPVRVSSMWLGANRHYYQRNREQVEAVWNWIGAHGAQQVDALSKKYAIGP
ncbi:MULTISPECIES: ABC transporter substrate-binding protein [unclassified Duganella]|uniref:substrate-binding periplasmic protein n=1 Tax=unclassified Duganella TaxID=2636909 RepID=UPI000888EEF7|nr:MULTISPECIES: amino acid ABC transporter substrate-binding protein [unclassified Duganella]SDG95277.1 hypothetical protein SAMN05216320_108217 [Duganella sp. OV458]SDJ47179.1 hypothetical protein SAMN05428973_104229 [Duganella sp. OV510]